MGGSTTTALLMEERSDAICNRELPCGHPCNRNCGAFCRACPYPCANHCSHGVCRLPCHDPCIKCTKPCSWICQHFRCSKRCFEICDRPRCDDYCLLKLPCGHACIGLCGEPCPRACRLCNPEVLDTISRRTLGESDFSESFVELVDCGHIFEVRGLDQWIDIDSEVSDGNQAVKLKRCPACRTVIQSSFRYSNKVKANVALVDGVKNSKLWQLHMDQGVAQIKLGNFGAAKSCFYKAIKLDPCRLEAQYACSIALFENREYKTAISELAHIVEKSCFAQEFTSRSSSSRNIRIRASDELATKALVVCATSRACMRQREATAEAIRVCDILLKRDERNVQINELKQWCLGSDTRLGRWWCECPAGHGLHLVTAPLGSAQVSQCPDCAAISVPLKITTSDTVECNHSIVAFTGLLVLFLFFLMVWFSV